MTYMLRERPDGQVEIVVTRATLVGIFPERDIAERVRAFLQDDDIEWPEQKATDLAADAAETASEADEEVLDEIEAGEVRLRALVAQARDLHAPARRPHSVVQVPAIVEKPVAPVMIAVDETTLTEAQLEVAVSRLGAGEKLKDVALDLGVSFNCLRGHWARHCRTLQKHMAEGGQQPCSMCKRTFTPSVTNPDKCARCSHD